MMSLELIAQLADEAAERAAKENKVPYVIYSLKEIDRYPSFPFPNLGSYVPNGWELVDKWFCDSTGMGGDNEPALSVSQLVAKLKENYDKGYGYAVVEQGQFQLYIGVFKQVEAKKTTRKRVRRS